MRVTKTQQEYGRVLVYSILCTLALGGKYLSRGGLAWVAHGDDDDDDDDDYACTVVSSSRKSYRSVRDGVRGGDLFCKAN